MQSRTSDYEYVQKFLINTEQKLFTKIIHKNKNFCVTEVLSAAPTLDGHTDSENVQ